MLKQFAADHPGSFLCECADVGCDRRLALTHLEYERVRGRSAYLVSLACVRDADVLERTDRYAIVDFRRSLTAEPEGSSRLGSSHQASSQRASSRPAPSPAAASPAAASPGVLAALRAHSRRQSSQSELASARRPLPGTMRLAVPPS